MLKNKLSIYIFLLGLLLPLFSASAGVILSSYKYAWSNNTGYINFENVVVDNNALSGYAWSKTHGWIKFNPAQGGVLNDGTGNLSGYAWGEQLGWINFDNVSINTATGKFSGTATGTLIGTLSFNCPNYCDVQTDWRPSSTCAVVANAFAYNAYPTCGPAACNSGYAVSGGACVASGGSSLIPNTESQKPKHIETNNQDLTVNPDQSGRYAKDTDKGQIVVEVPIASVSDKTIFYINTEPLSQTNQYLVLPEVQLINSIFYDIYAKDQNGNFVHSFASPITITLPVPINLQKAGKLAVYWLNETNNQWVLIPDAIFANNKAVFSVNHLTKFAILGVIDEEQNKDEDEPKTDEFPPKPSLPIPADESKKDKSPLKSSLPIPADESKNDVEQNLDQNIGDDEKPETIIEKIRDFFGPSDNEKDQPPADTDNQPEQNTAPAKNYIVFWVLLFLIILLWIFKKYRGIR